MLEIPGGTVRYGELFTGIGGMSLGLERAGMAPAWFAENDDYCSRVLAKHWPDVPNLGDVTKIEWEKVEGVDLVCGGFPCQPFSSAGLRRAEDDDRFLWPEVVRAVRVLRPDRVLLENVPGLLTSSFGRVAADLAACGYDFEWDCIPAAAVGAPHIRDRVFILGCRKTATPARAGSERRVLAHPESDRERPDQDDAHGPSKRQDRADALRSCAQVADAERSGLQGRTRSGSQGSHVFVAARREGIRGEWLPEPDVGRVAHGVPARVDRLRGLGNAVVPQVAEWIGRRILEAAA